MNPKLPNEDLPEVDYEDLQREKNKARELRQTQWWKNKRGENRCYYCQGKFAGKELTMDHVLPLARGGKSVKSNVVPACKSCNTLKHSMLPWEWEEHLRKLPAANN